MQTYRRWIATLLFFVVAILHIGDMGTARANINTELRQLYRKSGKHVQQKQYERAEVHLQTGITLLKRTLTRTTLSDSARKKYQKGLFRFSIALVVTYYKFMKKHIKAYDVLESMAQQSFTPSQRRIYQGHLQKIAPQVKTSLVLKTTPLNATLRMTHPAGWRRVSKAPLRDSLWPGNWTVVITAPGYQEYRLLLKLPPGGFLTRSIQLLQENTAKTSSRARVALFSHPGRVSMTLRHPRHGGCRGQAPMYLWMAPGTWQVEAKHPNHKPFRGALQVAAQSATQHSLIMQPVGPPIKKIAMWSSVGLAVLAGTSGLLMTYFAQKEFNDIKELTRSDQQVEFQTRFRDAVGLQIGGYVGFGLAAAGLVAAGVLLTHSWLHPTNTLRPLAATRAWQRLRRCRKAPHTAPHTAPPAAPNRP